MKKVLIANLAAFFLGFILILDGNSGLAPVILAFSLLIYNGWEIVSFPYSKFLVPSDPIEEL